MVDAQHLPQGRCQAGDRHLKFHEIRDNLVSSQWLTLSSVGPRSPNPSSSVNVHAIHSAGEFVVVEHSGRNTLPDGRRYDNNYCWVFRFADGLIQEVREYMDTQLVTETFGPDAT